MITDWESEVSDINDVNFSPDSNEIMVTSDNNIVTFFGLDGGSFVRKEGSTYDEATEDVTCGVYSNDGQFVLTGSDDGIARLYDHRDGAKVTEYDLSNFFGSTNIDAVGFSSYADLAFIGTSSNIVGIWDCFPIKYGNCRNILNLDQGYDVDDIAISQDDRFFAVATAGGLLVWELKSFVYE